VKSFHARRLAAPALVVSVAISIFAGVSDAGASSKAGDFKSFAGQVRSGLAICTAAAADAQVELGQIQAAKSSATEAQIVQFDTTDKNAQTACDSAKDNSIANLFGLSVPGSISYISSLGNVGQNAEDWATDDTTAVLHDLQKAAESTGGNTVAIQSQLQTDVATADSDAGALRATMNAAAKKLKVKNYGGLGLIQWGS
jgi:hypothetical protein